MSTKPPTSQVCNSQPCQQVLNMPNNPGYGATTRLDFFLAEMPSSVYMRFGCDDLATVWVNGTVVHHRTSCSRGNCASAVFNINVIGQIQIGNNVIQQQCRDYRCCGSSGWGSVTINY